MESYTKAPEIMKNEKYNDKCDLWSLGVIIYMLFFKKPPFQGQNEIALLNNIKIGLKKPLKKTNNELLDDLLSKLLKEDPKKRISWEHYFNHPFCKTGYIKIDINSIDKKSNNYLDENLFKEKYQILETIGEGSYGKVYKSKTNSNEFRAIKEIDFEKYKQSREENYSTNIEEDINKLKTYITNEINNMIICSDGNTNIYSVRLYDYLYNEKKIFIIMEYCDDNLNSLLKGKETGFSVEEISI